MRKVNSKSKLQYSRKPLSRPKSSKHLNSGGKKKKIASAEKENTNILNAELGSNQIMLTTHNNFPTLRMSKDSKIQLRIGLKDNFSEMNPLSRISTESFHNQENALRKSLKKELRGFKIEPKIIESLKQEVKKEFKKLERDQSKKANFSLFSPEKKQIKKHQFGVMPHQDAIKQQQAKSAQRVAEHKKKTQEKVINQIYDELDQKRQLSKERREKRQKLKEQYFDLPFKKPSGSAKKKPRANSSSNKKKPQEKRSSLFSPQKEAYTATGKRQNLSTGKKRDTSASSQKKREKILGYLNQQRMQRIMENKKKQKEQEMEQIKLDSQLKSLSEAYKLDLENFKLKQENVKESKEFKRKARKKNKPQNATSDQKKPSTRNKQLAQFQSQQENVQNNFQQQNLGRIQSQKHFESSLPERTEVQDALSYQTGRPVMSFNQQQIPQELTRPLRNTKSEKTLNKEEKLFQQLAQYRKRLQKAVNEQKKKTAQPSKVIDYAKYSKQRAKQIDKQEKKNRDVKIIEQLDEMQEQVNMIRAQLEKTQEKNKSPETPPVQLVEGIQILKTPSSQDSEVQGHIVSLKEQNLAAIFVQKHLRGRKERQYVDIQRREQQLVSMQKKEERRQTSGQFELVSPLNLDENEKSDLVISPDSQFVQSIAVERQINFQQSLQSQDFFVQSQENHQVSPEVNPFLKESQLRRELEDSMRSQTPVQDEEVGPHFLPKSHSEEHSFVNEDCFVVDTPLQIQDLDQKLPSHDATVNYLGSSCTPQTTEIKMSLPHNFFDSDALNNRRFTEMPVQNSQLGKPPLSSYKSREEQIAEIPLNLSSKLRKIVGSQSLAREVSRAESESNISNTTFDKNTFHEFTKAKLKNVVEAEKEISSMMQQLGKTLQKKIKKRQVLLEREKEELTARTFSRKQLELEKWVEKEKEELKETKKCFTQGCNKLSSLLNHLMDEQGRIKKQVKQIKDKQRLSQSFTNGFEVREEEKEEKKERASESGRRFSEDFISDLDSYQEQMSPKQLGKLIEIPECSKKSPFNYQAHNPIFIVPQQSPGSVIDPTSSLESLPEHLLNQQLIQIGRLSQEGEPIHIQQQHQQLQQQSETHIKKNAAPKLTVSSVIPSKKELEHVLKVSGSNSGRNLLQSENLTSQNKLFLDDQVPSGSMESSQKTHTPIMTSAGDVRIEFPEEIELLDETKPHIVRERERQAEELTEFILKHLVKEIKDRPFPPRAFIRTSPIKEEMEQEEPVQSEIGADFLLSNRLSEKALDLEIEKKLEQEEQKQVVEDRKPGIDATIEQVDNYVSEVFNQIKSDPETLNSVLENISQPLYKDPQMILAHLQNSMPDPIADEAEVVIPYQQSVLSVDLYLEIEKQRRGQSISQMKDSYQESNTESFIGEMENIHNKAIFDAINEAMDGFRPYGLKGPPFPWSKQSRTLTFKFGKHETIEYLLQKVRFKVIQWAHINAGMIPPFGATQRQKEQVELFRDQRMTQMLTQEADENECLWTDYEYEETQAKLDLADIVLDTLCQEVCFFLAQKQGIELFPKKEEAKEEQKQYIVTEEVEEELTSAEKFKREKEKLKAQVRQELGE